MVDTTSIPDPLNVSGSVSMLKSTADVRAWTCRE
jgi:hypothetical protein